MLYMYGLVFSPAQLDQEKTLHYTSTISNSADIWFGQLIYTYVLTLIGKILGSIPHFY